MKPIRPIVLVILAALTIVFATAAFYSLTKKPPNIVPDPLPIGQAPQAIRLTTAETGVTSLTRSQLSAVGLIFEEFSANGLQLSRAGNPVPFFIQGEGADSTLYFYAQGITNTLSPPPVYLLSPGQGLEMTKEASIPTGKSQIVGYQTHRWEENKVFLSQAEGADLWLGPLLFAPGALDIPLSDITPRDEPAQLTVRIWSNNQATPNPDHHVEIILNGQSLLDEYWEGIQEQTLVIPVPAGILLPANNTLTINAPGDTGAPAEQLFIDWVELSFASELSLTENPISFYTKADTVEIAGSQRETIILDITDATRPKQLTDTTYSRNRITFDNENNTHRYYALNPDQAIQPTLSLVPTWDTLKTRTRGADYIAIVADVEGFDEALTPLLKHREKQGLSVTSVSITQVFDEFGYGRQTPEAIRDFVLYTAQNWTPAPQYALLVGDATYDLYDQVEGNNQNLIPTYLVNTDFAGYVASDTWFTLLNNDALAPVMAIGRFPVQTRSQLEIIVAKTIAYEQTSNESWTARALLVADDDEISFNTASDELANTLDAMGYTSQKLYLTDNDDTTYNNDAIIGAINQGVGLINYIGHGSIEVWGDEKVFQADDASKLANRDRLPIFTTFTCLNGYFNHPQVDALAERLLWVEDAGIVAAVAPSGRTTTSQQKPIADTFYETLLNGQAETLGEALQLAKMAESDNDHLRDVIHTFNLLGDPALHFQLPATSTS